MYIASASCRPVHCQNATCCPGGRRRLPSPEGFKVDSTGSEVSAILCSAQCPLRARAVGGVRVPRRPTESWLPPDLAVSATLCHFTPCVLIPVLSSPSPHLLLWLRSDGWLRRNSFLLNVIPCDQDHTNFVQLPYCCRMIILKFLLA